MRLFFIIRLKTINLTQKSKERKLNFGFGEVKNTSTIHTNIDNTYGIIFLSFDLKNRKKESYRFIQLQVG